MNSFHTPVLLKEIIENLRVKKGKKYIDATIGGGGHSFEILKRGGIVLGIDCDQEAIEYVKHLFGNVILSEAKDLRDSSPVSRRAQNDRKSLILVKGNFRDIDKIAHSNNFDKVSGIIFDLGVSAHQLETGARGFSFQKEGPLDMRMDQDLGVSAKDLLKILTKGELYELFTKLGEESRAFELSRRIVRARGVKPIETTKDLVEIIVGNNSRRRFSRIHGATKIFQSLRIAVNDELNSIKEALPKAIELLEENGRLLVISFNSLEDRITKNLFLKFASEGRGEVITKKPITPSIDEIRKNRRSRSAKLRIFEKK